MSKTNNQTPTNSNKRSFLKTLALSLAFISFGGFGAILQSIFLDGQNTSTKSGFGSSRYGQ